MDYYGNVNPDLLQLTPPARRVLEVGCGEGAFAAAYRARHPDCDYSGVELCEAVAERAAAHVGRLLIGDFETMGEAEIGGGAPFDLIVMGDVLEHLRDTAAALAKVRRLLAPGGHLALCVPNIAHWTSLFHLMHGRWPQEDAGLFDRTHLRFFTASTILAALKEQGFRPLKQRPRKFLLDKDRAETLLPLLGDVAEAMQLDRQAFLERSSTLQYAMIAERDDKPRAQPLQILFAAMAPNLMEARTTQPASAMRALPDVHVHYQEKSCAVPAVPGNPIKIMIVQRPMIASRGGWKRVMEPILRDGWLVVIEEDDHPELVAQVLDIPPERELWLGIEAVHAVQTTTEKLASVFRERNPVVMPFANAAFTLPPLKPRAPGPIRIFLGALNRGAFSVAVAQALAPAIAAHPEIAFTVVHDRAFFDALPTERKSFHAALRYADYLDAAGACDIALLPLSGTPAELCKSDIKYVETASRGTAVIASPAVYGETIRDGATGLIARDIGDWATALSRLIGEQGLRERIVESAWHDIRDHRMFAAQLPDREGWYRQLWDRREELNAGLRARCPWLFD